MAAGLWSPMRHPPVIQGMKNEPGKQCYSGPLNHFTQKRPLRNYNLIYGDKVMTERFSIYGSQQFLIIHGTATHPSWLSSWLLFSLVLEQAHSYGNLTKTLMRVFNMAATTKQLPLMTMLQGLQSCVLLTSAHLCKRNVTFVRVVSRSSSDTSPLGSNWMNQTLSFVKTAPGYQ